MSADDFTPPRNPGRLAQGSSLPYCVEAFDRQLQRLAENVDRECQQTGIINLDDRFRPTRSQGRLARPDPNLPVRSLRSCPSPGPTSFRFCVREAAARDHQDPATQESSAEVRRWVLDGHQPPLATGGFLVANL